MALLVRLDDTTIEVVGTSEQILIRYPIAPHLKDDGQWGWGYTGGNYEIFDDTAEPCLDARGEPLFQDECGEDVPFSNVGVKHANGRVTPLLRGAVEP